MIPGPAEAGHDAKLAALARRYDRQFHAINAVATGLNADVAVRLDDTGARAAIESFLRSSDGFDFERAAGRPIEGAVTEWQKSAGLYAGVGIAADAYRYGVLRDQGQACEEVDLARAHLVAAMESLHRAATISGVPGVIARSLLRTDVPSEASRFTVVPLFDAEGRPLPAEKNNGTWRADGSGAYPTWIWEDSASRDMLVGWAMAFGAVSEIAERDPTLPEAMLGALREDARAIARSLMTVRESGRDLEIRDADGRTTFHGYLHENAFERAYLDGVENGFHAGMALGIVAGLARAARDAEIDRWLAEDLIGERRLAKLAAKDQIVVNLGEGANFSNYNMAFTAAWMSLRYIDAPEARLDLRAALERQLYSVPNGTFQPVEQGQSFYDFVYAAGMAESRPNQAPARAIDAGSVARGLATLAEFPEPPYWEIRRDNCDQAEIDSGRCTLEDGTLVSLLGDAGRGGTLISSSPVPMRVRPPSNYHWRSNPYAVNGGGDGSRLVPGVDFRIAYWLGRWVRAE